MSAPKAQPAKSAESGTSGSSPGLFHEAYEGQAPWDTGRPQAAFSALAKAKTVRGPILDVGCGTGENALLFAGLGYEVHGIDFVPKAISLARAKADQRAISCTFSVGDALKLRTLDRTFASVIDSGVFHVFSDADRTRYVAGLAHVLEPKGRFYMLVFSDKQPGDDGPRRIRQQEIRDTFAKPWTICSIQASRYENSLHEGGSHAWLAVIEGP